MHGHPYPCTLLWKHLSKQPHLSRYPFKAAQAETHLARGPERQQLRSKVTPSLGRGKDKHIHQSNGNPGRWTGAGIWFDYRTCPPVKTFQGITQGECPVVGYHYSPRRRAEGRHLVCLHHRVTRPLGSRWTP